LRFSLGKKILFLLISFVSVICGAAIVVGFRAVDSMNSHHFMNKADENAGMVAGVVNAEDVRVLRDKVVDIYRSIDNPVMSDEWGTTEFNEYIACYAHLEDTPEYQRILAQLRTLQGPANVDCLYLMYVDPQTELCLYLVDAAEEDPCPVGCLDPLYDVNRRILDDPTVGFPAYITDTEEYGWLVTGGAPIFDEAGEVLCLACDDISMDAIKKQEQDYAQWLSGALICLTALLSVVAIVFVRRFLVRPLNELSEAAMRYCAPEKGRRSTFEGLNIHTKDEIETLYKSMIQMEHDIDNYIRNLVATREALEDTREEADLMNDLAHRDALTGVQNKLAYDQELQMLEEQRANGETSFGIAMIDLNDLKKTNDLYGHDCGNVSLKLLSNTICAVFVHSPVFRIGGDEFTVVLRGHDYNEIEDLAKEFHARMEALFGPDTNDLEPWERISAAMGYALFDPAVDKGIGDVFCRADEQMYINKRQMKAGGGVR
jgi:diguanylate cyclase (GGDEF)-like protein